MVNAIQALVKTYSLVSLIAAAPLTARLGCTSSGTCLSPEGPNQQCEDDQGPSWDEDRELYGRFKRYYDDTPAAPVLGPGGVCPDPLAGACASKGIKEAFMDGPVDCGGQGWFCRILPQEGWSGTPFASGDANFAHCRSPRADFRDDEGHCHGSDDDGVYGWWVRDHWYAADTQRALTFFAPAKCRRDSRGKFSMYLVGED